MGRILSFFVKKCYFELESFTREQQILIEKIRNSEYLCVNELLVLLGIKDLDEAYKIAKFRDISPEISLPSELGAKIFDPFLIFPDVLFRLLSANCDLQSTNTQVLSLYLLTTYNLQLTTGDVSSSTSAGLSIQDSRFSIQKRRNLAASPLNLSERKPVGALIPRVARNRTLSSAEASSSPVENLPTINIKGEEIRIWFNGNGWKNNGLDGLILFTPTRCKYGRVKGGSSPIEKKKLLEKLPLFQWRKINSLLKRWGRFPQEKIWKELESYLDEHLGNIYIIDLKKKLEGMKAEKKIIEEHPYDHFFSCAYPFNEFRKFNIFPSSVPEETIEKLEEMVGTEWLERSLLVKEEDRQKKLDKLMKILCRTIISYSHTYFIRLLVKFGISPPEISQENVEKLKEIIKTKKGGAKLKTILKKEKTEPGKLAEKIKVLERLIAVLENRIKSRATPLVREVVRVGGVKPSISKVRIRVEGNIYSIREDTYEKLKEVEIAGKKLVVGSEKSKDSQGDIIALKTTLSLLDAVTPLLCRNEDYFELIVECLGKVCERYKIGLGEVAKIVEQRHDCIAFKFLMMSPENIQDFLRFLEDILRLKAEPKEIFYAPPMIHRWVWESIKFEVIEKFKELFGMEDENKILDLLFKMLAAQDEEKLVEGIISMKIKFVKELSIGEHYYCGYLYKVKELSCAQEEKKVVDKLAIRVTAAFGREFLNVDIVELSDYFAKKHWGREAYFLWKNDIREQFGDIYSDLQKRVEVLSNWLRREEEYREYLYPHSLIGIMEYLDLVSVDEIFYVGGDCGGIYRLGAINPNIVRFLREIDMKHKGGEMPWAYLISPKKEKGEAKEREKEREIIARHILTKEKEEKGLGFYIAYIIDRLQEEGLSNQGIVHLIRRYGIYPEDIDILDSNCKERRIKIVTKDKREIHLGKEGIESNLFKQLPSSRKDVEGITFGSEELEENPVSSPVEGKNSVWSITKAIIKTIKMDYGHFAFSGFSYKFAYLSLKEVSLKQIFHILYTGVVKFFRISATRRREVWLRYNVHLPSVVEIEINRLCSLACPACYIEKDSKNMPPELIKRIIFNSRAIGVNTMFIFECIKELGELVKKKGLFLYIRRLGEVTAEKPRVYITAEGFVRSERTAVGDVEGDINQESLLEILLRRENSAASPVEEKNKTVHILHSCTDTNFRRDWQDFETFANLLPKVVEGANRRNKTVRIWVNGCSNGAEVRTFVWELKRFFKKDKLAINTYKIVIFGTDINPWMLKEARNWHGSELYPYQARYVTVDVSGVDIRYIKLDLKSEEQLSIWRQWQREGFDIISYYNIFLSLEEHRLVLLTMGELLQDGGYLMSNLPSSNIPYSNIQGGVYVKDAFCWDKSVEPIARRPIEKALRDSKFFEAVMKRSGFKGISMKDVVRINLTHMRTDALAYTCQATVNLVDDREVKTVIKISRLIPPGEVPKGSFAEIDFNDKSMLTGIFGWEARRDKFVIEQIGSSSIEGFLSAMEGLQEINNNKDALSSLLTNNELGNNSEIVRNNVSFAVGCPPYPRTSSPLSDKEAKELAELDPSKVKDQFAREFDDKLIVRRLDHRGEKKTEVLIPLEFSQLSLAQKSDVKFILDKWPSGTEAIKQLSPKLATLGREYLIFDSPFGSDSIKLEKAIINDRLRVGFHVNDVLWLVKISLLLDISHVELEEKIKIYFAARVLDGRIIQIESVVVVKGNNSLKQSQIALWVNAPWNVLSTCWFKLGFMEEERDIYSYQGVGRTLLARVIRSRAKAGDRIDMNIVASEELKTMGFKGESSIYTQEEIAAGLQKCSLNTAAILKEGAEGGDEEAFRTLRQLIDAQRGISEISASPLIPLDEKGQINEDAEKHYLKTLQLDSQNEHSLARLIKMAMEYTRLNKDEKAIQIYEGALKIVSNHFLLLFGYGNFLNNMKKTTEGLAIYDPQSRWKNFINLANQALSELGKVAEKGALNSKILSKFESTFDRCSNLFKPHIDVTEVNKDIKRKLSSFKNFTSSPILEQIPFASEFGIKSEAFLKGLKIKKVYDYLQKLVGYMYGAYGISEEDVNSMLSIIESAGSSKNAVKAVYVAGMEWNDSENKFGAKYRAYKTSTQPDIRSDLVRQFVKGPKVFDIATGNMSMLYKVVGPLSEVTMAIGSDIVTEEKLKVIKEKDHRLDFIQQTRPDKLPEEIKDHSFNTVIIIGALHHMTDETIMSILKEAYRILKPDGQLVVLEDTASTAEPMKFKGTYEEQTRLKLSKEFNKLTREQQNYVFAIVDWMGNHLVQGVTEIPLSFNFKTREELCDIFSKAGFDVREEVYLGITPYKFHTHPELIFKLTPKEAIENSDKDVSSPILIRFRIQDSGLSLQNQKAINDQLFQPEAGPSLAETINFPNGFAASGIMANIPAIPFETYYGYVQISLLLLCLVYSIKYSFGCQEEKQDGIEVMPELSLLREKKPVSSPILNQHSGLRIKDSEFSYKPEVVASPLRKMTLIPFPFFTIKKIAKEFYEKNGFRISKEFDEFLKNEGLTIQEVKQRSEEKIARFEEEFGKYKTGEGKKREPLEPPFIKGYPPLEYDDGSRVRVDKDLQDLFLKGLGWINGDGSPNLEFKDRLVKAVRKQIEESGIKLEFPIDVLQHIDPSLCITTINSVSVTHAEYRKIYNIKAYVEFIVEQFIKRGYLSSSWPDRLTKYGLKVDPQPNQRKDWISPTLILRALVDPEEKLCLGASFNEFIRRCVRVEIDTKFELYQLSDRAEFGSLLCAIRHPDWERLSLGDAWWKFDGNIVYFYYSDIDGKKRKVMLSNCRSILKLIGAMSKRIVGYTLDKRYGITAMVKRNSGADELTKEIERQKLILSEMLQVKAEYGIYEAFASELESLGKDKAAQALRYHKEYWYYQDLKEALAHINNPNLPEHKPHMISQLIYEGLVRKLGSKEAVSQWVAEAWRYLESPKKKEAARAMLKMSAMVMEENLYFSAGSSPGILDIVNKDLLGGEGKGSVIVQLLEEHTSSTTIKIPKQYRVEEVLREELKR